MTNVKIQTSLQSLYDCKKCSFEMPLTSPCQIQFVRQCGAFISFTLLSHFTQHPTTTSLSLHSKCVPRSVFNITTPHSLHSLFFIISHQSQPIKSHFHNTHNNFKKMHSIHSFYLHTTCHHQNKSVIVVCVVVVVVMNVRDVMLMSIFILIC